MLDVDRLLKPIAESAPAGPDLRLSAQDATLVEIREFRAERSAGETDNVKDTNWAGVLRSCEEALANKSKDLEIAAFLAEALVHNEGFSGLQTGLRLLTELLRAFWETLHPGVEDGEIAPEIRARPISWLSKEQFLGTLKRVPLVGEKGGQLSWLDFELSQMVDLEGAQHPDHYQDLIAQGFITGEQWRKVLGRTSPASLLQSLEDIRAAETQLGELERVCSERYGSEEGPDLIRLRDLTAEIRSFLERNTGGDTGETTGGDTGETTGGDTGVVGGTVTSRAAALARLAEVADYFRRAEPHSPISYLVQRAVRWGQMPLEELLSEIVKDGSALETIRETLGIKKADG